MYYGERKTQMMPWKDIPGMTKYNDNIFLCTAKSNLLSRDHIIAITRGWTFDRNQKYAIALYEQNLSWCAGHWKPGIDFVDFYKQIQISIKEKNRQNKKQKTKIVKTKNKKQKTKNKNIMGNK